MKTLSEGLVMHQLESVARAGFWLRAAAQAIDVIIILLAYVVIFVFLLLLDSVSDSPRERDRLAQVVLAVAVLLTMGSELFLGVSFGKRLMRLRIRRQNGEAAGRDRLLLRWSTKYAPWIVALVGFLLPNPIFAMLSGFLLYVVMCGLLPGINEDRLTWHDQWSGTAVWKVARVEDRAIPASGATLLQPSGNSV